MTYRWYQIHHKSIESAVGRTGTIYYEDGTRQRVRVAGLLQWFKGHRPTGRSLAGYDLETGRPVPEHDLKRHHERFRLDPRPSRKNS